MSHPSPIAPTGLAEGHSVTHLTVVVLLLIPCVVALLLLNCFFLGYKLLTLSRKRGGSRGGTEGLLLRGFGVSDVTFSPLHGHRRPYTTLSEPELPHPVTSSRASDGASGSIPAALPYSAVTPRDDPSSGLPGVGEAGWCGSAPVLLQSSSSEVRLNLVPPNTPMDTSHLVAIHGSRGYNMPTGVSSDATAQEFNKAGVEYADSPSQTSCLNVSAVGPGLDSDFGASAGISLRILSADSDGLSSGALSSALEWDYYDPCYVRQNNVPKHQYLRPALHTKHYWV